MWRVDQHPTTPCRPSRTISVHLLARSIHPQLRGICGWFNLGSWSDQRWIVPPMVENSHQTTPDHPATSRPRTGRTYRGNSHRYTFQLLTVQSSTDHNSLSCTPSVWRYASATDYCVDSQNAIGLDSCRTFLSTADAEICGKKHRVSNAPAVTACC